MNVSAIPKFDDESLPGLIEVTVELKPVMGGTELRVAQAGIPEPIPLEMCYLDGRNRCSSSPTWSSRRFRIEVKTDAWPRSIRDVLPARIFPLCLSAARVENGIIMFALAHHAPRPERRRPRIQER